MKNSLHNLCSSISDGEHGTVIDVPHSGFFLLSSKNLIAGKVVFDSSDRQISETDFLRIKNRMRLKKGTVLISTVGEIGKTALIEEDNTPFVFQRSVGALNIHTDLILPEYVFYVLQYPAYQRYLAQKSGGSVQKGLYLDDIGGVIVSYPFNIADQKHIVDIIGSIDEKIQIDQFAISQLKKTVEEVFTHWFLRFAYPCESGQPFRETKDPKKFSKDFGTTIPSNWSVDRLGKHIKIKKGISYSSDDLLGNGIPMISLGSFATDGSFISFGMKTYSGKYCEK